MDTKTFLTPTADNFDQEVLGADGPVLVDFWAEWCAPCVSFKPIVQAVLTQRGVQGAFVNVDLQPALAQRFAIQSIPALKLFQGGKLVAELTGGQTKSSLEAWLEQHGA